jgi:hypothetical protein
MASSTAVALTKEGFRDPIIGRQKRVSSWLVYGLGLQPGSADTNKYLRRFDGEVHPALDLSSDVRLLERKSSVAIAIQEETTDDGDPDETLYDASNPPLGSPGRCPY